MRFYWNLRAEDAPTLVKGATQLLNDDQIPFRLKVVNDPAHYDRCDAGVLYVQRADYEQVLPIVRRILVELGGNLKKATPVFTKVLAPGLGLAEEPAVSGDSFGMDRCRLLAEAIVRIHERAVAGATDRLAVIEEVFAEDGNQPCNALFESRLARRVSLLMAASPLPGPGIRPIPDAAAPAGYLEAAALLGRRIADQAIWHDNRCTWVGASLESERGAEMALTYATLGPDLYEGTSGVALFLAELAAVTGDELFRRTAIGAIAHALARAPELAVNLDRSLYTGRVGIAVAAATVGAAVDETQYLEAAAQITAATSSSDGARSSLTSSRAAPDPYTACSG